jgi:hypothetical protein
LAKFAEKLHQLKTTKKGKIRIAYFGDSMIEGDLLTQTLRKLLQKEFGGYGVGFFPFTVKLQVLDKLHLYNLRVGKPSILWIKALKICIFLVLASLASETALLPIKPSLHHLH